MKNSRRHATLALAWAALFLGGMIAYDLQFSPAEREPVAPDTASAQWKSFERPILKNKRPGEDPFHGDLGAPQLPFHWTDEIREDILPAAIR